MPIGHALPIRSFPAALTAAVVFSCAGHATASADWLAGAAAVGTIAQPVLQQGVAEPTLDPLDITGRTFAGLRLPLAPVPGVVDVRGRKARVWIEDEISRAQRLVVEGEVSLTLGDTTLDADRVVLWIEKLPQAMTGDAHTYQVYAYLENVGSIGANAGTGLQAERLSVDGVIMSGAPVRLHADLAEEGRPRETFLREAEREFTRYLRELVVGAPVALEVIPEGEFLPETSAGRYPPPEGRLLLDSPVVEDAGDELFAADGVISFDAGQIALVTDDPDPEVPEGTPPARSLLLTEGVAILYRETGSTRRLQMSAERAVVFLSEGSIADLASFRTEDIEGIYLEGGVTATDGQYTVRGPKIYYDLPNDRAWMVDAVFWTYDERRRMPLYVRADGLRQESQRQFSADQATIANTRFARPHLSIGADSVTISRYARNDGSTGANVDARGLTINGGQVPFFYWPHWVGDPERFPLTGVGFESSTRNGEVIRTSWDAFSLLGLERPEGFGTEILLDYYLDRGPGLGTDVGWDTGEMRGNIFAYLIPDDSGTDLLTSGRKRDVDNETRAIVLGENRLWINDLWSLTTEFSYVSDPWFITAVFPEIADEGREVTTRARLERTNDQSQLALEAKSNLMDFVPNYYLLQSRGYNVDKLPEISYVRTLDDLTAEWSVPGTVTLASEYRLGQVAFNFDDISAEEKGFASTLQAETALGLAPDQSLADKLIAQGLDEEGVVRFDTRHELDAIIDAGPIRINPFAVGRLTAYDTDFPEYAPDESDEGRLWGAFGTRLSTSLSRVDNTIDSTFFDLHRTRHIVEPGVTVWHAGSTIDSENLPVYDEAVESLNEGTVVRLGVDQTWQTKRGGPGRWRNVDVLKVRTEYVWASGDAHRESPVGRFVEDRPELSQLGEFADAEFLWQASDPIGLTGRVVYDFEDKNQMAYSALGLLIDHGAGLRSSIGQRSINEFDSTVVFYSTRYEVTDKYTVDFSANYDTFVSDFERFNASMTRLYPNVQLGLSVSYNNITDSTSFGFIIVPRGVGQGLNFRTGGSPNDRASRIGG